MEDNAANRFKYWEDSSLISNLTTKNKQITVEHKRETEPNDSQNTPNKLAILDNPFVYEVISGNISDSSDYDYYGFSLQNKTKIKIDLFVNRTQNLFDHDHYLSINHKTEGRIEEKIIDKYGRIEKELDAGDYLVGIGSADDADYNLVVDIV